MLSFQFSDQLKTVITSLFIVIFTLVLYRIFHIFYFRFLKKNASVINSNPTTYTFLGHFVKAIIIIIGFGLALFHIPQFKTLATSMLAGAGILAVAVGLASQKALGNIVSGLFIVIFKPFKIGDRLNIRAILNGVVEDITLRHTVIRDFENRRIIIPNSLMSEEVLINHDLNDQKICRHLEIGISYGSDIDLAKSIIRAEILKHSLYFDNRTTEDIESDAPDVLIRVISLADSAVMIRAWVWASNTADSFSMHCDLLESIKKRFDKEGVEIPFPHRMVYHKTLD